MNNRYKRILLKLSGESLMGEKQYGIDEKRIAEYATQIKEIADMGIEIGIVESSRESTRVDRETSLFVGKGCGYRFRGLSV